MPWRRVVSLTSLLVALASCPAFGQAYLRTLAQGPPQQQAEPGPEFALEQFEDESPAADPSYASPPPAPPEEGSTCDAALDPKVQALEVGLGKLSKNLTVTTANQDVKLILTGAIVADLLYNHRRPFAPGTPFFLTPGNNTGADQDTFDAHARQTNLSLIAVGPKLGCDWQTGGMVTVILYDASIVRDRYGVLPLNAFGEIRNDLWRFAAGLQHDIFGPLDPSLLAYSKLSAAGNTGAFRLNASATRFMHISQQAQFNVTAGISEPTTTILNDSNFSLLEDNGWPNVEGRLSLGMGPLVDFGLQKIRPIEFGLSGIVGQLRRTSLQTGRQEVDVWGAGGDFRAALGERFGFKGEVFVGQALGEYSGGIFQTLGRNSRVPVRSVGGWAEVYYYLVPKMLHTHVGYGIDDPLDRDLGPAQIVRNDAIFANLICDVNKQIRVGCEATYRTTAFARLRDNEGFGFHTQFQFRF